MEFVNLKQTLTIVIYITALFYSRSNSKVRRSQVVAKNDLAKAEKSEDTSSQEDKGERGNLGICVTGLPMRSSDTSLRDGLFHEYKKHGKVTSVVVEGEGTDRFAIVSFKKWVLDVLIILLQSCFVLLNVFL